MVSIAGLLRSEKVRYLLVGAWNTLFGLGVFALLLYLLGDAITYPWILLISR